MLILSTPIFYSLEITPHCNNLCPGCGNVFSSKETRQPLSSAQWSQILTKISSHAYRLKVTGGEPILHPEFESIINLLQELDIPFALFTNGRWREPGRLVAFLRTTAQCSGLLISVHGASSTSHDAFTGVLGSFDETIVNIKLAVQGGLNVTTNTVITKHNYSEVGEVAGLARELGARCAVFNRYLGQPLLDIEPTEQELQIAIRELEGLGKNGARVKFGNCIPQCFYPSSSTGCLAGVAYCTIDPWGNVRPCNHAPLVVGNLLSQSVDEVWHSEGMQQWRGLIPTPCARCLELSKCHGGCRAMAMLRGSEKDPLVREPILDRQREPNEELVLYKNAKPTCRFAVRPQKFGYILICGGRVVPVSHEAKLILDAFDGTTTLHEIRMRFGQEALNFVGSLYKKGFVELS